MAYISRAERNHAKSFGELIVKNISKILNFKLITVFIILVCITVSICEIFNNRFVHNLVQHFSLNWATLIDPIIIASIYEIAFVFLGIFNLFCFFEIYDKDISKFTIDIFKKIQIIECMMLGILLFMFFSQTNITSEFNLALTFYTVSISLFSYINYKFLIRYYYDYVHTMVLGSIDLSTGEYESFYTKQAPNSWVKYFFNIKN